MKQEGLKQNKQNKQEKNTILTFDDGPSKYTPAILDILKEFRAVATFFVLGRHAKIYPDILKQIQMNGHMLGNHGFSHSYIKSLIGSLKGEIKTTEEIIRSITYVRTTLFRPPYGICGPLLSSSLKDLGYDLVLWDCDGKDWETNISYQDIAIRILKCVRPGMTILLHDGCGENGSRDRKKTVAALQIILEKLSSEGYNFATPQNR